MFGRTEIKRGNVESSYRLYCFLLKKKETTPNIILLCLIEACDGLMLEELEELTGDKRISHKINNLLKQGSIIRDNILPGRAWFSDKGSKGVYKISDKLKMSYSKELSTVIDIPERYLNMFSRVLFNFQEHLEIVSKYDKSIKPAQSIVAAAMSVLTQPISNNFLINKDCYSNLNKLGYIKSSLDNKTAEETVTSVNKLAYMLDKKGIVLK